MLFVKPEKGFSFPSDLVWKRVFIWLQKPAKWFGFPSDLVWKRVFIWLEKPGKWFGLGAGLVWSGKGFYIWLQTITLKRIRFSGLPGLEKGLHLAFVFR